MTTGEMLIRGGNIVDPASNLFGKGDLLIRGDKIARVSLTGGLTADKVIDADGCMVVPGLIDYHTHVFSNGTAIGLNADSAFLPQGVTCVVDQGSAGVTNYENFINTAVANSQVKIFSYLHASPAGLETLPRSLEIVNPKCFNAPASKVLFDKYNGQLLGLKIRQSKEIVGDLGLEPLRATIKMAEEIGCNVVVHTSNPPSDIEDLLALLRPGDVFTHVYQGKGSTIINDRGKVRQAFHEARKSGIIFDTADGRGHYAFSVIKAALADAFGPDIISTDVVQHSIFERTVFGLPLVITKYLNLGVSIQDIIRACTATPARILGMEGRIGTLALGADADVTVFKLKDMQLDLEDIFGEKLMCNQVFMPLMTVCNGRIAYRSLEI